MSRVLQDPRTRGKKGRKRGKKWTRAPPTPTPPPKKTPRQQNKIEKKQGQGGPNPVQSGRLEAVRSFAKAREWGGGWWGQAFSPEFRAEFPHLQRWFVTLANTPQFKKVVGDVELAKETLKPPRMHPRPRLVDGIVCHVQGSM